PLDLSDGEYFWRVSVSDGLAASPLSPVFAFKTDTKPPVITWLTGLPAAGSGEVSDDDTVSFSGLVSEPAALSLNGKPLSLEANREFSTRVALRPGNNIFELLATDEAGNTARLSKTISYRTDIPHLKILKPGPADWSKPGSTIYFEAAVIDSQAGIADEADGEIVIAGKTLADKPVYDKSSGKLSGFLSPPPELTDGQYLAKARLADQAGKAGEKEFKINIDDSAPLLTVGTAESVFAGSSTTIPLPLLDAGSGLDLQGTLIKIDGVSLEAAVTGEAGPAVRARLPLLDGSYEVTVSPRDNVGNTGEAAVFSLIVDTLPPKLFVAANRETRAGRQVLLISGEADDQHLDVVNFYNSKKPAGSLHPLSGCNFYYEIPLTERNNDIMVEAVDRAGNRISQSLMLKSVTATAGLIGTFNAGPCPFSPGTNRTLYFTFTFSSTPDELKIYVFDLTGTLVWKKEVKNYAETTLAWNGVDLFGRTLENGVYPYLASVSIGGQREIKKGKLIVLQ
ncbi:MAG: hypothetical protein PHG97_04945, partial [Candidatus Margulisbacteria bacterium]|nr:hypothetical protein [Candidatus Margulisiibacteriota bacterium]